MTMPLILQQLPKKSREKLRQKRMPKWMPPMLATLTHHHFSDPQWLFERKLDGERALFLGNAGDIDIISRNKKPQNEFYPEITKALENFTGKFVLDGELVIFDGKVTSFSKLQNRMHVKNPDQALLKKYPVHVYLFDILYLDGYDLCGLTLRERKRILKDVVRED